MAEEPTVPTLLDALDLESLSDDELRRLTQLLMGRGNDAWDWSPAPKTCSSSAPAIAAEPSAI
jgi:hypothetical protein